MIIRHVVSALFALLLCLSLAATALADSYDEATDGDISGDGANPTALTLTVGSNTVTATSIAGDVEYVAVTVPANHKIDSVMVDAYTFETGPVAKVVAASTPRDGIAFIAVQSGATFTEPANGADVANLLGYAHFGSSLNQVGTDILDDMASGAGAIGFTPPLVGNNYTFWMQQTGGVSTTYTLDFVVSALTPTALETVEESAQSAPRIYLPIFGK